MTLQTQSLNLNARQILIKRLSTTQCLDYTGPIGELVLDTTLKLLRIQDGVTPGGILITSAAYLATQVANLQAQINSILSNIDPAAIDSFTEVIANVNALLANNVESSLTNNGHFANLTPTGNLTLGGSLLPTADKVYSLGSLSHAWKDLYISNSTAYFGNAAFTVTSAGISASINGNVIPVVGNIKFPDGTVQSTAVNAADVAQLATLFTPQTAANIANVLSFVDNSVSFIQGLINATVAPVEANLTALIGNVVLEWTHPITSNVWTTYEYNDGILVTNYEQTNQTVINCVTNNDGNLEPEYDSISGNISVVKVNKSSFANLDLVAYGYSVDSIVKGNILIDSRYVDVDNLEANGQSYVFSLTQSIPAYANANAFSFTYDTVSTGIPVEWFNIEDGKVGNAAIKGATINYHAQSEDSGTVIGTIHMAVNNDQTHVTHTETGSGSPTLYNNILWGRVSGNENKLYYYRTDGLAANMAIHWTARVFSANYGA